MRSRGTNWESVVRDSYDSDSAKSYFGYDHFWCHYSAPTQRLAIVVYFGEEHRTAYFGQQLLDHPDSRVVAAAIDDAITAMVDEFLALVA